MKKLFLVIMLISITTHAEDFPLITPAEEKRIIREIPLAKERAKTAKGITYCTYENMAGMRLYLDVPGRLLFSFPSSGGVEQGMEMPALVLASDTRKMPVEIEATLKKYGIRGKISDQVQTYFAKSYEKSAKYETVVVLASYLDENNDIIPHESALILANNVHGTYFVGSTKNCK
ncbi:MAG: hypothetical protein V4596_07400 [Bdellovibrionota bacterium]